MGVTSYDTGILTGLIIGRNIKSVIEFGAQNNYDQGVLPAPYMKEWYKRMGITSYTAIDLTGEDGCIVADITKPFGLAYGPGVVGTNIKAGIPQASGEHILIPQADLVTDFGTSEHVSDDGNSYGTGKFNLEAYYNCWLNKHNLCKIGGVIFSENPKTGNWPGHGFNYLTQDFYTGLLGLADYQQFALCEHPAMGNHNDGWNIVSILIKTGQKFPTMDEFRTLDVRTS